MQHISFLTDDYFRTPLFLDIGKTAQNKNDLPNRVKADLGKTHTSELFFSALLI